LKKLEDGSVVAKIKTSNRGDLVDVEVVAQGIALEVLTQLACRCLSTLPSSASRTWRSLAALHWCILNIIIFIIVINHDGGLRVSENRLRVELGQAGTLSADLGKLRGCKLLLGSHGACDVMLVDKVFGGALGGEVDELEPILHDGHVLSVVVELNVVCCPERM
jgi:hypothetical protein